LFIQSFPKLILTKNTQNQNQLKNHSNVIFEVTKIKERKTKQKRKKHASYSLRNKVLAAWLLRRLTRPAGGTS